jgi:GNAT superfamily N-acetyltransferase
MHQEYRLEKSVDVASGVERIWKAGLYLNDEERSRVMYLVDPYYDRRQEVREVWMAVEKSTGRDVGMVMVSDPADDSGALPVINLYVHHDHLNRGIGSALLDELLSHHAVDQVAGYYTSESVRLYRQRDVIPALFYNTDEILAFRAAGNLSAARSATIGHDRLDPGKPRIFRSPGSELPPGVFPLIKFLRTQMLRLP